MISMGNHLYNLYRQAQQALNNCDTDAWNELEPEDQAAWEKTAADFMNS